MELTEEFPCYPTDGDSEFPEVLEPYALWHLAVLTGGAALAALAGIALFFAKRPKRNRGA